MRLSAWRWCVLAGLATLAASRGFGAIPNLAPCGDTGGASAIIAAEMVRGPGDLLALFGGGLGPCAQLLEAALERSLWLDMLAFIPAYAAFLCLGAGALQPAGRRIALGAILCVGLAAVLDQIEGLILFQLIGSWENPPNLFGELFWTVRPKFALLSLGELLIAWALIRRAGWPETIAGAAMGAGGLLALALLFVDPRAPIMMQGHTLAWAALLAVALFRSVRPNPLSPPVSASSSAP